MDKTDTPPPTPLGYARFRQSWWERAPAEVAVGCGVASLFAQYLLLGRAGGYLLVPLAMVAVLLAGWVLLARRWGRRLAVLALLLGCWGLVESGLSWQHQAAVARGHIRAYSMNNLRGIGLALLMYQNAHGDSNPPDLQALVTEKLLVAKALKHPGKGPASARPSDYFYLPPTAGTLKDAIVACGYDDCSDEGRAVLFNDGAVRWLTDTVFALELAKPHNAAFAAALRAAEGP